MNQLALECNAIVTHRKWRNALIPAPIDMSEAGVCLSRLLICTSVILSRLLLESLLPLNRNVRVSI